MDTCFAFYFKVPIVHPTNFLPNLQNIPILSNYRTIFFIPSTFDHCEGSTLPLFFGFGAFLMGVLYDCFRQSLFLVSFLRIGFINIKIDMGHVPFKFALQLFHPVQVTFF